MEEKDRRITVAITMPRHMLDKINYICEKKCLQRSGYIRSLISVNVDQEYNNLKEKIWKIT